MNDKLREIIDFAVTEEEFFFNFYNSSAEKTDIPSAKKLLLELAKQEKLHKEKLLSLDLEKIGTTIIRSKLDEIELEEYLLLTPLNELQKLKEIFKFAIEAESRAKEMYTQLASSVEDEEAINLFNLLSIEERKHEKLLTHELERLSI